MNLANSPALPAPLAVRPPIVTWKLTQPVSWTAPTKYTKASVRERNERVRKAIEDAHPLAYFGDLKIVCDLTKTNLTDALRTLLRNEEIERVHCNGIRGTHYGYRSAVK